MQAGLTEDTIKTWMTHVRSFFLEEGMKGERGRIPTVFKGNLNMKHLLIRKG